MAKESTYLVIKQIIYLKKLFANFREWISAQGFSHSGFFLYKKSASGSYNNLRR